MPFFIQRKLEIRVIQIPFLDGPLRIDCLFPGDRVQAAGALSVVLFYDCCSSFVSAPTAGSSVSQENSLSA